MPPKRHRTATRAFGSGNREGHDASAFYGRRMYAEGALPAPATPEVLRAAAITSPEAWRERLDRLHCRSAEQMAEIPDGAVALAFTSPPYNVGKEYDADLGLAEYLRLIATVGREVYRVLLPGGRYVVNIANLGRSPYIPLTALFWQVHLEIGFLPMGEIVWQKAESAGGSCAWGSWQSAKAPRLRDVHEYLLVMAKMTPSRPDKGQSDISKEEFLEATTSVWRIPPESARRVGHPAPFPLALAERVVRLFSYVGDVVLDPFAGSGTTLLAAARNRRRWVGYEIVPDYCRLAEQRLASITP